MARRAVVSIQQDRALSAALANALEEVRTWLVAPAFDVATVAAMRKVVGDALYRYGDR